MKHDWMLDDEGAVDVWRIDSGFHNGPECKRCGATFCQWCSQDLWDQDCPASA